MHRCLCVYEPEIGACGLVCFIGRGSGPHDVIADRLKDALVQFQRREIDLQNIVEILHREYLQHEDPALASVQDPMGWHRAHCILSLMVERDEKVKLLHLGTLCVLAVDNGRVNRIAPIHDLQSELQTGTLDKSIWDISKPMTPSSVEHAVGVRPGTLRQLERKSSSELLATVGSYPTRVIGDRGWSFDLKTPTMPRECPEAFQAIVAHREHSRIRIFKPRSVEISEKAKGAHGNRCFEEELALDLQALEQQEVSSSLDISAPAYLGISLDFTSDGSVNVTALSDSLSDLSASRL